MKLYNSTDSQISMPLNGGVKLVVPGHSFSTEFMPNDSFLTLVASVFTDKQIALVVSGPFEINMCAKSPACALMVVQSREEALRRFLVEVPEEKEEAVVEENKEEEVKKEEVKEEKPIATTPKKKAGRPKKK